MDVTNEQRAVLSRELDRVLGTEATTIMMAHLPQGGSDGLATKADLERFALEEVLAGIHTREEHAAFRSEVNQRFTSLEGKLESLIHQFRAELRAEINSAITGQTRAVIVSLIGTMTVLSGFMFALIQTASP